MASMMLPCGNLACSVSGILACGNCFLIKYCSKECQKTHYKVHKSACKSPLSTASWAPGYTVQRRKPSFIASDNDEPLYSPYGHVQPKYLFGNIPSFDHLKFAGVDTADEDEINMLFAASGDLRNLITTVLGIASEKKVKVVLNDREPYVVIRNLLVLLLLGTNPESESDSKPYLETAIHLWFSAFLTPAMSETLKYVFNKHLGKMRSHSNMPNANESGLLATTVQLDNGPTIRCVLPRRVWNIFFTVMDSPPIPVVAATKSRHEVTMARSRVDYRERFLEQIHPQYRQSFAQYWEDGLVLPFSMSRKDFTVPNCTLFYQATLQWLLMDNANPLNSCPIKEIYTPSHSVPAPKYDTYGLLYFYVFRNLTDFHHRLVDTNKPSHHFSITCCSAQTIASSVPGITHHSFDLIEVSNITDNGYLGVPTTLRSIAVPLLKPTGRLISLFMNYFAELEHYLGPNIVNVWKKKEMELLMSILGKAGVQKYLFSPVTGLLNMAQIMSALPVFEDPDLKWDLYSDMLGLEEKAEKEGMRMLKVEKPHRFNVVGNRELESNPEKVMKIVKDAALSGTMGTETYVVWGRK
ncbi:hypothetical protein EX30DRAFT_363868 [Ascodesmis nigricans]|uniref:MYND-type domain-containing protein n=1 Tax=Ascodesmis nigricans TaxID=341454 RepID=A0A4S2MY36_9PEZI|nr:hypothetical protein EX30DRAFT_363868 [Ascodesmis nigricans]